MSYEKLDVNTIHSRDQIEQLISEVTAKQEYLRAERNATINSKNDKALTEIKTQMTNCLKFENALIQRLKML